MELSLSLWKGFPYIFYYTINATLLATTFIGIDVGKMLPKWMTTRK